MKIKILISIFRGEGFFHSKIILKFESLRFYNMDKLLTIALIFFFSLWVIRLEKIFCLVFEFYTYNHFMYFCTFLLLFSDRVLRFFFIYPLVYTSLLSIAIGMAECKYSSLFICSTVDGNLDYCQNNVLLQTLSLWLFKKYLLVYKYHKIHSFKVYIQFSGFYYIYKIVKVSLKFNFRTFHHARWKPCTY